jgi:hypothetical protein
MLHASLPMYDWPEVSPAWDRLWRLMHARLGEAGLEADPPLRRTGDFHEGWLDPELIVGQTCGWPFVNGVGDHATAFARFDFGLPDIAAGDYCSRFIVRPGLFSGNSGPHAIGEAIRGGLRVAVNAPISQSGYRVLGECFDEPFELTRDQVLMSGSHRESIRAVASGRADVAAIDAVSWLFALDHEPAAEAVEVAATSRPAPGLPLIVARGLSRHVALLRECLGLVIGGLEACDRATLHLHGHVAASDGDYDRLRDPPYGNLRLPPRS